MLNSPCKWNKPSTTGSPIGKGAKTRAKVNSVIGTKSSFRKYIVGGK